MAIDPTGLISPGIKVIEWIVGQFKKPDPVAILKRRDELRKEFEQKLPRRDKYGVAGDAIIRDIKRVDNYPETDEEGKGVSPWFKVEVKGLYHRGLEVFMSWPKSINQGDDGEWSFCHYKDPGAVTAYTVGRMPFDLIQHVDWEGDEYYPNVHVYCQFKNGEPYEEVLFYRKSSPDDEYLIEVEGFRPYAKKKWFWQKRMKKRED